jgi:hypothetical protein
MSEEAAKDRLSGKKEERAKKRDHEERGQEDENDEARAILEERETGKGDEETRRSAEAEDENTRPGAKAPGHRPRRIRRSLVAFRHARRPLLPYSQPTSRCDDDKDRASWQWRDRRRFPPGRRFRLAARAGAFR